LHSLPENRIVADIASHTKMTFVDSHMHFWDRALMPYTWLH